LLGIRNFDRGLLDEKELVENWRKSEEGPVAHIHFSCNSTSMQRRQATQNCKQRTAHV